MKKNTLEKARMARNRLKAKIVRDRLIISIGVDTLAFAAEHCDDNPKIKIKHKKKLAEDVILELERENEIGATMLTDLFDEAVSEAFNNGSVAFADTQTCKSCKQLVTKGATECPHCLATDFED